MNLSTVINWLAAIVLMILFFLAYALCRDDTRTQLHDICAWADWPTDSNAKLAYERACKGRLVQR